MGFSQCIYSPPWGNYQFFYSFHIEVDSLYTLAKLLLLVAKCQAHGRGWNDFSPCPAFLLRRPFILEHQGQTLSMLIPHFSVSAKLCLISVFELVWYFPSPFLDDVDLCLVLLQDPELNMDFCFSLVDRRVLLLPFFLKQ